jgi:hypothetical protein
MLRKSGRARWASCAQTKGVLKRLGASKSATARALVADRDLDRRLFDARGTYRGELSGPKWDEFGRTKTILLNAYRPENVPAAQDWVLVLEPAN